MEDFYLAEAVLGIWLGLATAFLVLLAAIPILCVLSNII